MSENSTSLDDVVVRLKSIFAVSKDAELAKALGISPQTVSSWRQRSAIPYAVCVECSKKYGFSLDWLLYGGETGDQKHDHVEPPSIIAQNNNLPSTGVMQRLTETLQSLPEADLKDILSEAENRARLRLLEKHLTQIQNELFRPDKTG